MTVTELKLNFRKATSALRHYATNRKVVGSIPDQVIF
jgi:hypothetical protein